MINSTGHSFAFVYQATYFGIGTIRREAISSFTTAFLSICGNIYCCNECHMPHECEGRLKGIAPKHETKKSSNKLELYYKEN